MSPAMFELYAIGTSILIVLILIWVVSIYNLALEKSAKLEKLFQELLEKQDRTNQLLEKITKKGEDGGS